MALPIRRREFFALMGVSAWPPLAVAQGHSPVIGYLGATSQTVESRQVAALEERLRSHGWIVGRNLMIHYRWAEGRQERAAAIAAELISLKVDVMVTWGTGNAAAMKRATSTVPVVFAAAADPVGTGLVASLARPGGNLTGLSAQQVELAAKRVELFREAVPNLRRLAVMAYVGGPGAMLEAAEAVVTARRLGLEPVAIEIRGAEDIASAFASLGSRADGLYVSADPFVNTRRVAINKLAVEGRMPTMYSQRLYTEAGGLMSYGPSIPALFQRAADFVDKVLRGTKPADIPVEQPAVLELIINVKTANVLGLKISPTLLALADEVIE